MSACFSGLTCECFLDGELVRMEVHDLSFGGFFGETTARFEPGHELSAELLGGAASQPVCVEVAVESCLAPGARGPESEPGVRFRLLRFAQDFSLLLSGGSSRRHASEATQQPGQSTPGREEEESLANGLGPEDGVSPTESLQEQVSLELEDSELLSEGTAVPPRSEDSQAPEVTVIDDGELDDVVRILEELGVKADRPSPDGDSFVTDWLRPRHLLVVTAKRALALRLPLRSRQQDFASIAVFDGDAQSECSRVRSLGYQYVISRPIHPLAMSMLFRQAIFPDPEQRVIPREIVGCSVRWSCGWAGKRSGVILDLSPLGCQLLVQEGVAQGTQIKIRVPGGVAGGRGFTLVGQVIRSSPGDAETTLGISFDELSVEVRQSLQQLLALPGPCRLTEDPLSLEGDVTEGPLSSEGDVTADPLSSEGDAAASKRVEAVEDLMQMDRRRRLRAGISQEVLALDHDSSQIKHVFVSSNLSVDGMHIEAHPSLVMGDQLELALYEESERGPFVLSAVVARDDGHLGWWLRFGGITPEVYDRLTQILDRFPPVMRLNGPDCESGRVALGEVLARKPPGEAELA